MKLPMLAVDADLLRLSFPYIALPKVDGVRAYYSGKLCGVVARSGRHFTNPVVRDQVRRFLHADLEILSLIHISEPTRRTERSRMPSSA